MLHVSIDLSLTIILVSVYADMDESFEISPIDESYTEDGMHVCRICEFQSRYKSNLTRHLRLHSDDDAATTHTDASSSHVHCGKIFKTKYDKIICTVSKNTGGNVFSKMQ